MHFDMAITGFVATYIFMLAAFGGWVIIGNVPAILHTPLMSGSNFVHGIVVIGGIMALLNANSLKSEGENTAPWLLKQEMRRAGMP